MMTWCLPEDADNLRQRLPRSPKRAKHQVLYRCRNSDARRSRKTPPLGEICKPSGLLHRPVEPARPIRTWLVDLKFDLHWMGVRRWLRHRMMLQSTQPNAIPEVAW